MKPRKRRRKRSVQAEKTPGQASLRVEKGVPAACRGGILFERWISANGIVTGLLIKKYIKIYLAHKKQIFNDKNELNAQMIILYILQTA